MFRFPTFLFGCLFLICMLNPARGRPAEEDDDEVIGRVKEQFKGKPTGWEAGKSPFYHKKISEKRQYLGAQIPEGLVIKDPIRKAEAIPLEKTKTQPGPSFDARDKWPKCEATIMNIRQQADCGACWAFAAASILSDRLCILTNGAKVKNLSVQDQLSCMPASYVGGTNLCGGNDVRIAMRMFVNDGIVTEACLPYTSGGGQADLTKCPAKCSNGATYKADKTKGKETLVMGNIINTWSQGGKPMSLNHTYTFSPTGGIQQRNALQDSVEKHIMREIMTNGPVTSSMDVYNDFMSYKKGIYQKTPGSPLVGGHAIKLIGWGSEGGVPYWIAVNSWGSAWGEKGTFKVLRGSNHVNMERYIVSATPIA